MRAKSLTKLPYAHSLTPIKKNQPNINAQQEQQFNIISQRKQIQGTLRELHKLQSQIYQLNVADNPHSSSPVKKQIKQLSYLYENMNTEPKTKNSLNIKSRDIQLALRLLNKDYDDETQLQKQISQQEESTLMGLHSTMRSTKKNNLEVKNKKNSSDHSYKISKDALKYKFSQITKEELNYSFIAHNSEPMGHNQDEISVKQLHDFVNYTDCDDFDPIQQAYKIFLNESGRFDPTIYNQYSQILGLPPIKNWNTFLSAIHQIKGQFITEDFSTISLQQFRYIFDLEQ